MTIATTTDIILLLLFSRLIRTLPMWFWLSLIRIVLSFGTLAIIAILSATVTLITSIGATVTSPISIITQR